MSSTSRTQGANQHGGQVGKGGGRSLVEARLTVPERSRDIGLQHPSFLSSPFQQAQDIS